VIALGVIGYTVIADEIADRNRPGSTAVQVDDRKFSLEYFANRAETYIQQNGGPGTLSRENPEVIRLVIESVQGQLIEEQILLRFAGEQGQATTEDEVNTEIAKRMSINKDDPNFSTRFQEELTRTGLTEEQYRDIASATVLAEKVKSKFTSEVPANAESIHYRLIALAGADQATADDLKAQIEGGADFAALAKERSVDNTTKENGGDASWVPRGLLDSQLEEHLFAQEINAVTTYPTASNIYVYQVIEKVPDRPVEEAHKTQLADKKFNDWVSEKRDTLDVREFDLSNSDNLRFLLDHAWASA
jgi:parvulin-like peptidyl-prolyl isomerase